MTKEQFAKQNKNSHYFFLCSSPVHPLGWPHHVPTIQMSLRNVSQFHQYHFSNISLVCKYVQHSEAYPWQGLSSHSTPALQIWNSSFLWKSLCEKEQYTQINTRIPAVIVAISFLDNAGGESPAFSTKYNLTSFGCCFRMSLISEEDTCNENRRKNGDLFLDVKLKPYLHGTAIHQTDARNRAIFLHVSKQCHRFTFVPETDIGTFKVILTRK